MSTTTDTRADHRLWMDLHRDLRAAGWRYTKKWLDGGRDQDGAPWDDGYYEHVWKRGEAGQITAFASVDSGEFLGNVSYWPDLDAGDPDGISVSVGLVQERGPEWLRQAMMLVGILPQVWAMPTIPAGVTALRDESGRVWTAGEDAFVGRVWRFGTLRFHDASLLASIYGPTFTEVKS